MNETKSIIVFVPDTFEKDNIGIIEGTARLFERNLTFFITNDKLLKSSARSIGYCSEITPQDGVLNFPENLEWLHINNKTGAIKIAGLEDAKVEEKVVCIEYDYSAFKNLDTTVCFQGNYGEHFESLVKIIQESSEEDHKPVWSFLKLIVTFICCVVLVPVNVVLQLYRRLNVVLLYSATAVHLNACFTSLKWALYSLKQDAKITLKVGNVITSRLFDFICGLIFFYFTMEYQEELALYIQNTTDIVIQGLEELLKFLMGSPVGLKLNFAFNTTLGNFFLYNITLWRAFLHAANPLLRLGLHLLVIPGIFGLSFQAALFSDLISFSTIHVYCIYVYAARLYGIQVRGLVSLWRLFIGRKYNPMRKRVDSLQYTHHQLFIGTLGFTVLLFLLPTTFVYYAVFTVFRIGLKVVNGVLLRLRYILECFPLYVVVLWVFNAPSVKGAVRIKVEKGDMSTVHVSLGTLPLWQNVIKTLPETLTTIPSICWSSLFHSVSTGSLL